MDSYEQVMWAFTVGVALAAAYMFFVRRTLGAFVKKLLDHNAFSPETAVTFEEIGQKPGFWLRRSLRPGTDLSATVSETGGRYYIPEDKLEKAEHKYKSETVGVWILLVALLIFVAVTAVAVYVFPQVFEMLKNLFSSEG